MSSVDIAPTDQNLDNVFIGTNYRIDFYQREYKWRESEVQTLLDDIFFKFDKTYPEKKDLEPGKDAVQEYPWYYLDTYITNEDGGDVYIVDGQQRLTTLSLILIKLYHLAGKSGVEDTTKRWVQDHIAGTSAEGFKFRMGHGKREEPMKALFEGELPDYDPTERLTAANIVANYRVVSEHLDEALGSRHRIETFIYYFLLRLVLVRLNVQQTDVPMVFEVINDRGVSLDPHEILKGKLLGEIDRSEVENYNNIWEGRVGTLDANGNADDFFRTYLKSRFAETRSEGRTFDEDYQRVIYKKPYSSKLDFATRDGRGSALAVKRFVEDELTYFVDLYRRVERLADDLNDEFPHVYYNGKLNDMDMQVLLIFAACNQDDEREDEKLRSVAYEFDRFYSLLQLNGAYDSNRFNDAIYRIRNKIEGRSPEVYREIFEEKLLEMINERRDAEQDSPFRYAYFRQTGYQDLNQRFLRYFFARIEKFISEGINRNMDRSLYNLVQNDGPKNGHHVEHILSNNEENLARFDGDEERFEQERNRLGGLLLLRGRDNQSSGNELFEQKLKTYDQTLHWNQSLHENFYHSKKDHEDFFEEYGLAFKHYDDFGEEAVEERTRLLFEMTKEIWD